MQRKKIDKEKKKELLDLYCFFFFIIMIAQAKNKLFMS